MTTRTEKHALTVRQSHAGFGLISVMVAMVLLSVGILSLTQVLTQSVAMQTISATRTTALDVARAYMEDVKGRDPLTLSSEAEVRVNDRGQEDPGGVFTRELTVETVGNHLFGIAVIVTAPRTVPLILETWIYDGQ